MPNLSVWISIVTSELRSSTPVRSARLRSASERGLPARSSRLISRSSSDSSGYANCELGADALQRLVEAEARLDADDQQVEHVGERQADAVGALLRHARQHHARQDVAEAEAAERDQHVRLDHDRRREAARTARARTAMRMPKKIVSASSRR